MNHFIWIETKIILNLFGYSPWLRTGKIDFVEHRNHGKVFLTGKIEICDLGS